MFTVAFISLTNFTELLKNLQENYEVYAPVKKDKHLFYRKCEESTDDIVVGQVRAFEPLKSFFFLARELVAEGFKPDVPASRKKPLCIVGVKACDLKGFKVQDHVFSDHDYRDPFYMRMRQDNLIISADCTCAIDTCFCLAVGVKPYPQEDFDINLSQVEGGFVVQTGSDKGKKILEKYASLFQKSGDTAVSQRDAQRQKVVEQVQANISENDVPPQDKYKGIIEKNYESDIWKDEANTCVECGACNTICPTCHCFLLYDQKDQKKMARLRMWDSCMIKDFARVAGGANPRSKLWMRLRNRFEKKFDFFPKVADVYACTGCGRCITACPAKIDIRRVLKKLVSNG